MGIITTQQREQAERGYSRPSSLTSEQQKCLGLEPRQSDKALALKI